MDIQRKRRALELLKLEEDFNAINTDFTISSDMRVGLMCSMIREKHLYIWHKEKGIIFSFYVTDFDAKRLTFQIKDYGDHTKSKEFWSSLTEEEQTTLYRKIQLGLYGEDRVNKFRKNC
jgi:hypothetical protein